MESAEGRDEANGNSDQRNALRIQGRDGALTVLARIRQRTKENKEERFTNLLGHIKVPLLTEAYFKLRRDAASGVDGVTWNEYGNNLQARLTDLQDRIHRGSYHPHPVRRVHIPKASGGKRPLGIPALEDKIVQQATRMVLEPIYESMFLGFSYGFRPKRNQHQALDALAVAIGRKVNWVLDADIASFFDTVDHDWMKRFIEHRIADGRMVRLLMKWLKAGVMEKGAFHEVESGTPQGGIISPLLANIYLHYALDLWAHHWRGRHARGEMYIVRYADDVVMGFQHEADAREMHKALGVRLAGFNLKLHEGKTRVLRFGRFAARDCHLDGDRKPRTFDFLGFTHIMAEMQGSHRLMRRTARKKRQAKLAAIRTEIRQRRHDPVPEQHRWLCSVLRGHYQYYGVPTNRAESSFRFHILQAWQRQLQRRSDKGRWTVEQLKRNERRFPLPLPTIHHPWPHVRFNAR